MANLFGSFTFEVTADPYKGRYEVDFGDFTATEMGDAQQALNGKSIETLLMETGHDEVPPPLPLLAVFVWLQRRRGSQAKGLAYKAVADAIRWSDIDFPDADEVPEESSPET